MTGLDWVVVLLYFAGLAGVTWWVMSQSRDTADDYFLAGRNLGWFVVGASIFASNIGSEHLVGLAGSGRHQRRGAGALRAARVVPAGARLGVRAVLHAVARLHDAGVPRAAVLAGGALGALAHLAGRVRHHEDRGRHLRRRRRVRRRCCRSCSSTSAAPSSTASGSARSLVVVLTGLYTVARRHARRRVHRGACRRSS